MGCSNDRGFQRCCAAPAGDDAALNAALLWWQFGVFDSDADLVKVKPAERVLRDLAVPLLFAAAMQPGRQSDRCARIGRPCTGRLGSGQLRTDDLGQ
ncbi:MAG: hypothetical protein U0787_23300 [Polyangia bacterium]